ncbi:MAG: hypothetical protein LBM39_00710 [Candidatus Methanoplasma sp.]|nr:hypothetical protein [Candidatus Methanoplasma sp.]
MKSALKSSVTNPNFQFPEGSITIQSFADDDNIHLVMDDGMGNKISLPFDEKQFIEFVGKFDIYSDTD